MAMQAVCQPVTVSLAIIQHTAAITATDALLTTSRKAAKASE